MSASACAKVLHSSAHPISLREFTKALSTTWNPRCRTNVRTVGLAISGGVDSMALAVLCSKLLHDKAREATSFPPGLGFQAFVVDHGVRDGSSTEANAVLKLLESRGISTRILKINWGFHDRPAELPNFESLARKHRFQILGKACRDLGINSLFLAHHEDDQAETVMMRLIHGHRMLGLGGMKNDSEIPECHGLYGVHESGEDLNAESPSFTLSDSFIGSSADLPGASWSGVKATSSLTIERGGIRVYRPLLEFSKARLIATCHEESTAWFEDSTNQDPAVTTRNAVRYMFRSHQLPPALSRESMLGISKKAQSKMRLLESTAATLFKKSNISNFETCAGTLMVEFASLDKGQLSQQAWDDRGLVAALLLRQVILIVTPEEHVPTSSLHSAVKSLFPEIFPFDIGSTRPVGFTTSGLQFQPVDSAASEKGGSSRKKCEWFVSRQPYPASSKLPVLRTPPATEHSAGATWSKWELYDGRFWIRIQNLKATPIHVRPLRKDDLKKFKTSLPTSTSKELRSLLKRLAPGNVRWTLPALVMRELDGKEVISALPTLGISVPNLEKQMKWEVRFKNVDTTRLLVNKK